MKQFYKALILISIILFFAGCETKDDIQQPENLPEYLYLDAELPVDPDIRTGKLNNGLTYYVRENSEPEGRAEFRLVVKAGSILEDEHEKGLAHFVEHMAFNGTEHFAKQEIIDFLESIGMRFGPDINAYTSFDETVYRLTVPTDDPSNLKTALLILEDWAFNVLFEPEEIEKEKGVIVEEWRGKRSADRRIRDKQLPVIYKDSKYALRQPIGDMDIVRNLDYETVYKFYSDWYRPELMAVIAVGDFDSAEIEEMIKTNFSGYDNPPDSREREAFDVPDNKEILFSVESDPEATESKVGLMVKHEYIPSVTVRDYRESIVKLLYHRILNDRLSEISRQPDAPFINAYSGLGSLSPGKDFYALQAYVIDNGIIEGFNAVLLEAEKVKRFGFTETELERKKEEVLSWIEQAYNEMDNRESDRLAAECIRNFLEDESMPGLEFEYEIYENYVPGITLDEVNALADFWITEENRIVLASMPEKEGIELPTSEELLGVLNSVQTAELSAYVDETLDKPLLNETPEPGKVSGEKKYDSIGVTEWILSNGVRVVLKPTNFKNDEIIFTAYSPGGHSLVEDSEYISAVSAASIINMSGVGDFSLTQLEKKLSGQIVSVTPWIKELYEGMNGSTSPEYIKTMFELIYLYFTAPRLDEDAVISYKTQIENMLINKEADPENIFWDTVKYVLSQKDYRSEPWTVDILDIIDGQKAYNIYLDRFKDASDFTFVITGSFETDEIKPLVETYLGGLPSINRNESWKDLGVDPPEGIINEEIYKGNEPKSEVVIVFNGDFEWTLKNVIIMKIIAETLNMNLTDTIREELGGTYSIGVYHVPYRLPDNEYYFYIYFGCDPERVDSLTDAVFNVINGFKDNGPDISYFNSTKEIILRDRETNLSDNSFWASVLQTYYINGQDPGLILEYTDISESASIEEVRDAAEYFFNEDRYVRVVLYPDN
jgi:zinc protease